jgi:hypothetical protein
MIRMTKQAGTVADLAKNPLLAAALAPMFAGAKLHRGLPRARPRYALLQSEAFGQLDEANQQHVTAALRHYAKARNCSISDLAWAVAPQKNAQGLHPVLLRKWEDIERQQWEEKRT